MKTTFIKKKLQNNYFFESENKIIKNKLKLTMPTLNSKPFQINAN